MTPQARDRVMSLIDFLSAAHARRFPPVHDVSAYQMDLLREADLPKGKGVALTPAGDRWLTVDFVDLPEAPVVPGFVAEWLEHGPAVSPHVRPAVLEAEDPSEVDDINTAERWVSDTWVPWSVLHGERAQTKALYRRLFELRDKVSNDRDGIELLWGFGRVRWQLGPADVVDHPLMTIPVEIDIDGTTNQISVRPSGALAVESLYLADVNLDDRAGFTAIRQSLEVTDSVVDPWDDATVDDLVRRIVRCLDQDGSTVPVADAVGADATADTSWILYLRRRQPDYQGFLDTMRDLYRDGATVPDPLQALVIDEPSTLISAMDPLMAPEAGDRNSRPNDPLLLPLPTNEEQERIVALSQTRPGVTVQGPPGTGKSHTIANIISHYVAYGKRVLVVAEKEQALRVLADKVPAGIRDLTVSVLGADDEGRRRLESSVNKIQTKVTGLDRQWADEEIVRLGKSLDEIDQRIARLTDRLLLARALETGRLEGRWGDLDSPSVSEAAAWVSQMAPSLGYIPDALPLDTKPPVSPPQLAELLDLVARIGVDRAEACALTVPSLEQLPQSTQLLAAFGTIDGFAAAHALAQPELSDLSRVDETPAAVLELLAADLVQERSWSSRASSGWLAQITNQLSDAHLAAEWPTFVGHIKAEREQILTTLRGIEADTISVPPLPDPLFDAQLADALDRLSGKGKLGVFAGNAKKALADCTINGRTPSTAEDVTKCIAARRVQELRLQLSTRWSNRVGHLDGPALDSSRPEAAVGAYLDDIDAALAGPSRWLELRARLATVGIHTAAPATPSAAERLIDVVHVATRRAAERQAIADLDALRSRLDDGARGEDASPLWSLLLDALTNRHTERWDALRSQVADLQEIAPQALRLRGLRDALRSTAPRWAADVIADPARAGEPGELLRAWQWRQLDGWVGSIARADDPAALQRQLESLSVDRRREVAALVSERAWRRLADNIGDAQRAALNSYLYAVRRFGKTGGKFAARWLEEIRQALNASKDAVPVWIMTTSRALASFRPDQAPPFDLLIIDEASQIGLEAVPLLALAKSTIVVGDDKQTSPENVGADQQTFFNLLDDHLQAIPKYRTLFDINASLYDLAFQKFPGEIMLTEHFRSLPEIIQFSNTHVYDRRVIPLRDQPPRPGWRPLGAVKVLNGYRRGDVNEPEADAVVDLIAGFCESTEYDGMTIGVVSLLGSSQSKVIWEKLYERLGPDAMSKRSIRCGEAANFQGDERDVIVISTVVATDPARPEAKIGAMTGEAANRRINVAASRARNQMWVVHSVDPDRFPNGDLRAALIRHCSEPGALEMEITRLHEQCESDFEREVLTRILARGYRRVRTQQEVGRYRIDIVVEGPDGRLAVECDGDRWHGPDVWHKDRSRQQVLERAGWTFERIRGSAFYRDRDNALEPLWKRLDELGIPIGDEWITTTERSEVRIVGSPLDPSTVPVHVEPEQPSAPAQAPWAPPTPPADVAQPPAVVEPDPAVVEAVEADPIKAEPIEVEPLPARSAPDETPSRSPTVPTPGGAQLQPYRTWSQRSLIEVALAKPEHLLDDLLEIIGAEGPMHAISAYQIYVKASGGHRVGRDIRSTLNQVLNRGLQSGKVAQIQDSIVGQVEKTLYVPGTSPVVVRELGPRSLTDVPRSEIATLIEMLGQDQSRSEVQRNVLKALGLTKLTSRAVEYINECASYRWSADSL